MTLEAEYQATEVQCAMEPPTHGWYPSTKREVNITFLPQLLHMLKDIYEEEKIYQFHCKVRNGLGKLEMQVPFFPLKISLFQFQSIMTLRILQP